MNVAEHFVPGNAHGSNTAATEVSKSFVDSAG